MQGGEFSFLGNTPRMDKVCALLYVLARRHLVYCAPRFSSPIHTYRISAYIDQLNSECHSHTSKEARALKSKLDTPPTNITVTTD